MLCGSSMFTRRACRSLVTHSSSSSSSSSSTGVLRPLASITHNAPTPRISLHTTARLQCHKYCDLSRPVLQESPTRSRARLSGWQRPLSRALFQRHCSTRRHMHLRDDIESAMNASNGREVLPTNVKPTHYDLTLEPDLAKHTYTGTVSIE